MSFEKHFLLKDASFRKELVAQGTIEYLVIIAIVVLISLVVVGLLVNQTDSAQGVSSSFNKLNSSSGLISISEAVVDSSGDGLVTLANNSGEVLTITSISVGGSDVNYSGEGIYQGETKIFSLSDLGSGCSCVGFEGQRKTCEVIIYAESEYGLEKDFPVTVSVECVPEAVAADPLVVVEPDYDLDAPSVLLEGPFSGYATQDSFIDVNFFVSDDSSIQNCKIIVDGSDVNTLTSIVNGGYNSGRIDLVSVGQGRYDWDVNCVDSYDNYSLSSNGERALDYFVCPSEYVLVPKNAYFDVNSFCVMKFNAKNVSGVPTSQAADAPWSLSVSSAYSTCATLGAGYHLITNREWMTIARNIEDTNINDMDDDNGVQLAVGHSDGGGFLAATTHPIISGCDLNNTMENSSNAYVESSCEIRGNGVDDKGYYGTGNQWDTVYASGSGKSQLRVQVLSNKEIIWDLAGNTHDVVDLMEDGTAIPTGDACTSSSDNSYYQNDGSNECTFQNGFAKTGAVDKKYEMGPSGNYNRNNGVGLITGTGASVAAWKGGARDWTNSSGIYSVYMWSGITTNDGSEGFRCVIVP
ncbi:MAG: hypothetical protein WC462_00025 [archaeon]